MHSTFAAEHTSRHMMSKAILKKPPYRNLPSTSNTTDSKTLQGSQISYDDKV